MWESLRHYPAGMSRPRAPTRAGNAVRCLEWCSRWLTFPVGAQAIEQRSWVGRLNQRVQAPRLPPRLGSRHQCTKHSLRRSIPKIFCPVRCQPSRFCAAMRYARLAHTPPSPIWLLSVHHARSAADVAEVHSPFETEKRCEEPLLHSSKSCLKRVRRPTWNLKCSFTRNPWASVTHTYSFPELQNACNWLEITKRGYCKI